MLARESDLTEKYSSFRCAGKSLARAPIRGKLVASTAIFSALFIQSNLALSQVIAPNPQDLSYMSGFQTIDRNGVDLLTGYVNFPFESISIGIPEKSGLSRQGRGSVDWLPYPVFESDSILLTHYFYGKADSPSETFIVSGNGWSDQFGYRGPPEPDYNTGASLIQVGAHMVYHSRHGDIIVFASCGSGQATCALPPGGSVDRLLAISWTKPDGEVISYSGGNISSSAGWQIQDISPNGAHFGHLVAFNSAIEPSYCAITATNCSLSYSWPAQSFAYNFNLSPQGYAAAAEYWKTNSNGNSQHIQLYSDYILTNPPLSIFQSATGRTITMTSSGKTSPVFKYNDGVSTWTYSLSAAYGSASPRPYGICQRTTTVTNPDGTTKTIVSCPSNGRVYSIKDELGRLTTLNYDKLDLGPIQIIYPEGNQDNYVYDARGNVIQLTKVPKPGSGLASQVLTAGYDATCSSEPKCNKPNWVKDAQGHETDYAYDNSTGLLLSVTKPADNNGIRPVTAYSYQQIATYSRNPSGGLSQAGLIWKLTGTATCRTTQGSTSINGLVTTLSCAGGTSDLHLTTVSYAGSLNALPTSVTESSGDGSISLTTTTTYDAVGNVIAVQTPLGNTTTQRFDSVRNLVGVVRPNPGAGEGLPNIAERRTYDADNKLIKSERGTVASPSDADWSNFNPLEGDQYTYDLLGRRVSSAHLAGGSMLTLGQFGYDFAGRIVCETVRMNAAAFNPTSAACSLGPVGGYGSDRITTYVYDGAGQRLQERRAVGTSLEQAFTTFTYSPNGKQTSELDANNNLTTFTYDGFDRLAQINYPVTYLGANQANSGDFEAFSYDSNDNKLTFRRRDGNAINYGYDALNRQISKLIPGQRGVYTNYDLQGRPLLVAFDWVAGPGVSYRYDGIGRLTQESTFGRSVSFAYDGENNLTQTTWPDGNTVYRNFDNDGRLIGVGNGGFNVGYGYDNYGRHSITTHSNNQNTTYGYDGVDRLTALNHSFANAGNNVGYTFTYSPASQVASRTMTNLSFSWPTSFAQAQSRSFDGLNRDAAIAGSAGGYDARGNLTFDGVRSFTYDLENRLLSESGPTSASLSYDPLGRLNQTVINGAVTQFLYAGPDLVGEYDGAGNLLRRYVHGSGVDSPDVWFEGAGMNSANVRFLHKDRQGSIIGWSDGSGNLQQQYSYGPYGEPNWWGGSRFRYTGQIELPELQLYHYKARVYDPVSGRFLQTDPVGYKDGPDWYLYVHDDPLDRIDPSGENTQCAKVGCSPEAFKRSAIENCDRNCVTGSVAGAVIITGAVVVPVIAAEGAEVAAANGARVAATDSAEAEVGAGGRAARNACCFVAGTLVTTQTGLRPIESVAVGDLVYSRDTKTGETSYKPVVELIHRHNREIYKLTVQVPGEGAAHETIFETTNDHPWRTAANEWVQTSGLKPGDLIQRQDGAPAIVVVVERTHRFAPTYNLEVADYHSYFVGKERLWVHNAGCSSDPPPRIGSNQRPLDDAKAHTGSPAEVPGWGAPRPPRPGGSPNAVPKSGPEKAGNALGQVVNFLQKVLEPLIPHH